MLHKRYTGTTLLTLLGLLVIVGGFVTFGLLPSWYQEHQLQQRITAKRAALEQRLADSRKLTELDQRIKFLSLEVRDYSRLVPDKNNLGNFLESLSHELTQAGVQNTAVQALGPTRLGRCQQLPIQVHGTGTFPAIRNFLIRMESLDRKSSVSKLILENDPTMNGQVTLDMTLSIYNALPPDSKPTSE